MKHRIHLPLALLAATICIPLPTTAQTLCNAFDPDMRVVGYTPGPMGVPIAMCVRKESSTREPEQQQPAPDPMQARTDALRTQIDAMHSTQQRQRELLDNPEFQRLRAGYWEFPEPGTSTQAGVGCSATFKSMTGMMGVMVPAQRGQPVMTMFTGMDVPKPGKPTPVEIVFHQEGGPMKMPAMNFAMGEDAPGTIAVGVRDLPSLLSGFKETEEVAIDLDGKRIYELTYHDGNAMKSHLQRCEAAKKQ